MHNNISTINIIAITQKNIKTAIFGYNTKEKFIVMQDQFYKNIKVALHKNVMLMQKWGSRYILVGYIRLIASILGSYDVIFWV